MIRSMTGFGRAAHSVKGVGVQVEIATLNHRHHDAHIRLPRLLTALEPKIRSYLKERFLRGKVSVHVSYVGESGLVRLEIDHDAAAQYIAAARELCSSSETGSDLKASELLSLPGVTRSVEASSPPDGLEEVLCRTLADASNDTVAMRVKEGTVLESEIRQLLTKISVVVGQLEGQAEAVSLAVRERLHKRALQLQKETELFDEARLHQELVIAADRMDIREELVRLQSHVDQFKEILDVASSDQPVGRRLEFLLQEMSREANTVGSKAGDAALAYSVVELKTGLERVREQIQNVE